MDDKMALIPIEQQQLVKRVSQQIAITDRLLSLYNDDLPELIPYRKGDKWGFCDRFKNIVIECIYDEVTRFENNRANVTEYHYCESYDGSYDGMSYYKSSKNLVKIRNRFLTFDFIGVFSEGLAVVGKKSINEHGYINELGEEVIACIYENAYSFSEGLACVEVNNKWGFIDSTGKEVIPFIYKETYSFKNGLARVKLNNKWGYINQVGNEIIPSVYEDASG